MRILSLLFFLPLTAFAAEDWIRNYPHPIICKPYTIVDDIQVLGEEKDWVILEWTTFVASGKDKLLFKYKGQLWEVPHNGYVCSQ